MNQTTAVNTVDGTGGLSGPLGAGATVNARLAGAAGIPADAKVVLAYVTLTGGTAATGLTAWPTSAAKPNIVQVSAGAGQSATSIVHLTVGSGGSISLFNAAGSAHLRIDVMGWYR